MSERNHGGESLAEESGQEERAGSAGEWIADLVKIVVFALVVSFGLRSFVVEPFNIPSESMLPTLMIGDYLFVSKYPYGYSRHSFVFSPKIFRGRILGHQPERGDVIVFKLPRDNRTDYIKRLIGLPGDRIQMVGGQLYINGKPVRRERVDDFLVRVSPYNRCPAFMQEHDSEGRAWCRYPQYRETLPNGVSYMTLDIDPQGPADDTRVFTVPDGHYFMMGDNRDNSADSRRPRSIGVGYVPFENLVGRAEMIFFSTDGRARWWNPVSWFRAVRWDRLFVDLHPGHSASSVDRPRRSAASRAVHARPASGGRAG